MATVQRLSASVFSHDDATFSTFSSPARQPGLIHVDIPNLGSTTACSINQATTTSTSNHKLILHSFQATARFASMSSGSGKTFARRTAAPDQAHEKPEEGAQAPVALDMCPPDWPDEKHDICLWISFPPHTGQLRSESSEDDSTRSSKTSLHDLHLYS